VYKNLCYKRLGGTCQQNEMIEVALTYDFAGTNIDLADMMRRSAVFGNDYVTRFLLSAPVQVGSFTLTNIISGSDAEFQSKLEGLKSEIELAASVKATRAVILIEPADEQLAYHENFEMHRSRLGEMADLLAEHQIQLGIGLQAVASLRAGKECPFIHQAEELVTLIKTIGRPNVGLAFDLWNWTLGEGTVELIKSLDGAQVVSVELAELPADADRAAVEESQRLLPATEADSLSAQYVQALLSIGYDGPVSVTPHASQFGDSSRDGIVQRISVSLDDIFVSGGVTPVADDEPATEATASS